MISYAVFCLKNEIDKLKTVEAGEPIIREQVKGIGLRNFTCGRLTNDLV